MMGGRGGRRLVLLCAVATLLLVSSSSAVGGVRDESLRDLERGRFVGRLERQRASNGRAIPADGEAARGSEEPEQLAVDVKKPAEGIWDKARSFVSEVASAIGNGVSNPMSFVSETTDGAGPEKVEKTIGREGHIVGRHHGSGHSRWAEIRDLIRNGPEALAAAAAAEDISATEPLSLHEDAIPVITATEWRAKIAAIVRTVVLEESTRTLEPNLGSSCADALEAQVKILVKGVRSALREQLCNFEVASGADRRFCNFFNYRPTMATFQSFSMIGFNPVLVTWRQTSKTAACSSENPFSSFRDSLQQMELLAHQYILHQPEVIDTEDKHFEHDVEHHMFHRHRREHGDSKSHWWQRMLHKKPHHEHGEHEKYQGQHMLHKHMKAHRLGERQKHGDHERHWWQRLFGMKHEQMRHQDFEHAHELSAMDACYYRSVEHLSIGIGDHLAATCESTSSPNVIAACKFAKEHHFLIKTWLAVKSPLWMRAARSCIRTVEDRPAPDLGVGGVEAVERENLVDVEARKTIERQLITVPRWIARGCGKHRTDGGFSKALRLRGHLTGFNHGENEARGLVRQTHLIVLGGFPSHVHDLQVALEILQPLTGPSEDQLTELQERLTEFVRDAGLLQDAQSDEYRVLPSVETEMNRPILQDTNFHISANPRHLPASKGGRFRISAMPRVPRGANSQMPVIGLVEDVSDDTNGSAEPLLQDKIPKATAEGRADM